MDNNKWIALGSVGIVAALIWAHKRKQLTTMQPSMGGSLSPLGSTQEAWGAPPVRGSL